jgi:hypothetical protein
MSQQRLFDSLTSLFASHRTVFWHDVESEFASSIESMTLDGVQLEGVLNFV